MKNLLLLFLIAGFGLTISSNPVAIQINSKSEVTSIACQYGQCSAIAKSTGVRCKNCCQKGSNTCWSHR